MDQGAESGAMLAELQAYKEAERAERGRRSTMYIRPEDNGFEAEQEDVNPFAFVARDEGAHHDGATSKHAFKGVRVHGTNGVPDLDRLSRSFQ